MISIEKIQEMAAAVVAPISGAEVQVLPNPAVPAQSSLLATPQAILALAQFLRDNEELQFDFCSNVTGVDWPEKAVKEKVVVEEEVDGEIKKVEKEIEKKEGGYLEAVYHLYSVSRKQGPLVLRCRTADRVENVAIPSLTPVWKSADFQEREVFDLYGIRFVGHPDLRRLLLWDEFEGHPMRKDYIPDDDSYCGEEGGK